LFQGQLEQARITVSRLYDADLPSVAGDAAQLKQLFLNLFKNAMEAMEPGGELSIRLSSPETAGRHTLVVEVTDTGAGIPEAVLGRVFDPFVTTKPQGSGLGLSICRGIADAHRATIHIRNRPHGRGTTVVTEFPAVEPRT
ncbi:MAG: ATP-binding protein, partial [Candidatus Methylomirabilia bacterium]